MSFLLSGRCTIHSFRVVSTSSSMSFISTTNKGLKMMKTKGTIIRPTGTRTVGTTDIENNNQPTSSSSIKSIYTLSHCPPTDDCVLSQIVTKHGNALTKYLQNKPIADHNIKAWNELNEQILNKILFDNATKITTLTTTDFSNNVIPVILDSGCGTGRSSIKLGTMYPNHIIVGIDRSIVRLSKNKNNEHRRDTKRGHLKSEKNNYGHLNSEKNNHNDNSYNNQLLSIDNYKNNNDKKTYYACNDVKNDNDDDGAFIQQIASNVWIVRAELSDFWRCIIENNKQFIVEQNNLLNQPKAAITADVYSKNDFRKQCCNNNYFWNIEHHYMLYPNPYPKKSRLLSRWYAHPAFPLMMLHLQQLPPLLSSNTTNKVINKTIVLRSNWKQYLIEFAKATDILNQKTESYSNNEGTLNNENTSSINFDRVSCLSYFEPVFCEPQRIFINVDHEQSTSFAAMTNFEEKYFNAGEDIYELILQSNR